MDTAAAGVEDWSVYLPKTSLRAFSGAGEPIRLLGREDDCLLPSLPQQSAAGTTLPHPAAGQSSEDSSPAASVSGVLSTLDDAILGCSACLSEVSGLRATCETVASRTALLQTDSEDAVKESSSLNRTAELVADALWPFDCVELAAAALGLHPEGRAAVESSNWPNALGVAASYIVIADRGTGEPRLRLLKGIAADGEATAMLSTRLVEAGESLLDRATASRHTEAGRFAEASKRLLQRAAGLLRSALTDSLDAAGAAAAESEEASLAAVVSSLTPPAAAAADVAPGSDSGVEVWSRLAELPAHRRVQALRSTAASGASRFASECEQRGITATLRAARALARRLEGSRLRKAPPGALGSTTGTVPWSGGTGASALVESLVGMPDKGVGGGGGGAVLSAGGLASTGGVDMWPNVAAAALQAAATQYWDARSACAWGRLRLRVGAASMRGQMSGSGMGSRGFTSADEEAALVLGCDDAGVEEGVRRCWEEAEVAAKEEMSLYGTCSGLRAGSATHAGSAGSAEVGVVAPSSAAVSRAEVRALEEAMRYAGGVAAELVRSQVGRWGRHRGTGAGRGEGDAALMRLCSAAAVLREEAMPPTAVRATSSNAVTDAMAESVVRSCVPSALTSVLERLEFLVYSQSIPALASTPPSALPDQLEANPHSLHTTRYPEALALAYAAATAPSGAGGEAAAAASLLFGSPVDDDAASPAATGATSASSTGGVLGSLPALWHPSLERCQALLAQLRRVLDAASMRRLGADVVRAGMKAMLAAAQGIERHHAPLSPGGMLGTVGAAAGGVALPRAVDASLFLCKHLLQLREQLGPLGLVSSSLAGGAEPEAPGRGRGSYSSAASGDEHDNDHEHDDDEVGWTASGAGMLLGAVGGLVDAVGGAVGAPSLMALLGSSAASSGAASGSGGRSGKGGASRMVLEALAGACDSLVKHAAAALVGDATRKVLPSDPDVSAASTPIVALSVASQEDHDAALEAVESTCTAATAQLRRRLNVYLVSATTHRILWRAVRAAVVGRLVMWRASLQATHSVAEDEAVKAWATSAAARVAAVIAGIDATDSLVSEPRCK